MSKSLAETVNFAEAVQKKTYEKRAQQVDTFVKSETAEQKLARSGKMQTAKAIEAIASLGGTALEAEAKKREQEVKLIQEDLANITAAEIQEQRDGAKPYSSETFLNLPLRFQTRLKRAVGLERSKRLISEAESSIDNFTLLDDVARLNHIESFMPELVTTSGMDAHELLGFNKGWQEGVDRINNAAAKAKTAEGEKKIESDFKGVVAGAVTAEHESFLQLEESGDLDTATDAYKIELRNNAAKRTYETIEAKFKSYTNETGIKVPAEIKKQWVRESLLEAAKATNNPYLLDPANLPKEYQDETTKYFFADARVALNDKFKSDQRSAVAASNQQRVADRNQADEDAYNGTITYDTPNLTLAQSNALRDHEERGKLTGGASTKNKNNFMLQVQKSITEGSDILVDMDGNPVKDKHGNEVSLDRASLDEYLLYNPLFLDNEQTYLSNNLGGLLVGIDTAAHFPTSQVQTWLDGTAKYKVPEAQIFDYSIDQTTNAKRLFRRMYSAAQRDKGWDNPLTSTEIQDLQDDLMDKLREKTPVDSNNDRPNLDGEVATTGGDNGESTNTSETNGLNYEQLSPKYKDAWERIKDNPEDVKKWTDKGLPVPEISDQELIQNLETVLEAENEPSLTTNKNSKDYKVAAETLSDMSDEEKSAVINDYAENAIEMLQAQIPNLPYTMRASAREFLQAIRENPEVAFEDTKYKRYYD
jgi:hypothetical protein